MDLLELTVDGPPGAAPVTFTIDVDKAVSRWIPWFAAYEIRENRWNFAAKAMVDCLVSWDVVGGDPSKPVPITQVSIEGLGRTVLRAMVCASVEAACPVDLRCGALHYPPGCKGNCDIMIGPA